MLKRVKMNPGIPELFIGDNGRPSVDAVVPVMMVLIQRPYGFPFCAGSKCISGVIYFYRENFGFRFVADIASWN